MRIAVNVLFQQAVTGQGTQGSDRGNLSIFVCPVVFLGSDTQMCAVPFFVFKSIMKGKQPKMTELENKTATPPRMMTIRQVAQTGVLPEHALRQMEKQKMLPCFYVGKKCLINYDKLVEQLQQL